MRAKLCTCDLMARLAVKTNLVLDKELDTLDGSGGSLGDGGRDTTHCCPMLATGSLFPSSYRRGCAGAINALRRRMAPLHHATRCNVLRKSTTKPGMPMNSFLLWLQWLSARWSQGMAANPLEAGGWRRATYSTSLVGVPTAADILSVVLGGYKVEWRGC